MEGRRSGQRIFNTNQGKPSIHSEFSTKAEHFRFGPVLNQNK